MIKKIKKKQQRLLSLYLSGEIALEEYLEIKANVDEERQFSIKKEERIQRILSEMDTLIYEDSFLCELLESVTVHRDFCKVTLKDLHTTYNFQIQKEGSVHHVILCEKI